MATKRKIMQNLYLLVNLYQVCSYDASRVKTGPAPWVTSFNIGTRKENFNMFFSETGRLRTSICGMQHLLVDLYKVCSNDVLGVKTGPALGGHKFQHSATILILVLLKRNNHWKTLSFYLMGYLPSFAYTSHKSAEIIVELSFPP